MKQTLKLRKLVNDLDLEILAGEKGDDNIII